MIGKEEIDIRFSYHAPKLGQALSYENIRSMAKDFALELDKLCPDSREKSMAFTHLDECVMNANASIARRE